MNLHSIEKRQRGVALVVGLLLLLVSSFIAIAAFQSGKFQERMASNQYNKAIAFMAAEHGASILLEEVANGLDLDDWENSSFADWQATNSDNTSYFRAADILSLGTNVWAATIEGVSRRAANDPENLALSLIDLRFERVVPGGGSAAAINLVGPLGTFEVPNSNALKVQGADNGPAIAVLDDDDRDAIEEGLDNKGRLDNYTGGIGTRNFDDTLFRRADETNGTLNDLEYFVDSVCAVAGPRCSSTVPDGTVTKGSPHAEREPQLTVVTGDATINFQGSDKGAGVLIVAGDLVTNGTPSWDGIILVLGGSFNLVGGGTGGVDGTIYVLDVNSSDWTINEPESVSFLSTVQPKKGGKDKDDGVTQGGGGGNALFKHNCELVQSSLEMVTDGMALTTAERETQLAQWLDEFGCGGITGPGTGPVTYRVLRWVETLN